MTSASTHAAPQSLHEEVATRLRELIYSGEVPPGSFIDEPALCTRMAISRTPLREALKVLTAEGLMRHEPRRGCFVNEVTERDLDEIFPVIALLEGRCAYEAAARVSDADLRALDGLHQRLRDCAQAGHIAASSEAKPVHPETIIPLPGKPLAGPGEGLAPRVVPGHRRRPAHRLDEFRRYGSPKGAALDVPAHGAGGAAPATAGLHRIAGYLSPFLR